MVKIELFCLMFLSICASGQFLRYFAKQAMISYKIYNKQEFKLMMWILEKFRPKPRSLSGAIIWVYKRKVLHVLFMNQMIVSFYRLYINYIQCIMVFVKPTFKIHFTIFTGTCIYACDMLVEYKVKQNKCKLWLGVWWLYLSCWRTAWCR